MRLFELLDRARAGRAVWISGQAGAGKTSLLSSWIASRKLKCLWYNLDEGDSDPATLFHFLKLAAEPLRTPRTPLPQFTPEHLIDPGPFARRFFQELFGQVSGTLVAVFDNHHRLAPNSPVQQLLDLAIEEAPANVLIVIASRWDVPAELARWRAAPSFTWIDPHALNLDPNEAQALVQERVGGSPEDARKLLEVSDGWTAGLVLLLRARQDGLVDSNQPLDAFQLVGQYFTAEVYARLPEQTRAFLQLVSIPRRVTPALAAALTGEAGAAAMLTELHQQHFFVEQRAGANHEPVFELHPLFRSYLREKLHASRSATAREEGIRRAACLLEEQGEYEEAAELSKDLAAWPELSKLIAEHGPRLFEQGRGKTIERWLAEAPQDVLHRHPWISYWLGVSRSTLAPVEARPILAWSLGGFKHLGDRIGALLACAAGLQTYRLEMGVATDADVWIGELEALMGDAPEFPSTEVEARIIAGGIGMMHRDPNHPLLKTWVERALDLMRAVQDSGLAIDLAFFAFLYHQWRGDDHRAGWVRNQFEAFAQPGIANPRVLIWRQVYYAMNAWHFADHEGSYAAVDRGLELGRESGLQTANRLLVLHGVIAACGAQDPARARSYIERMIEPGSQGRLIDLLYSYAARCGAAFIEGNLPEAREWGLRAVHGAAGAGVRFAEAWLPLVLASVLLEARAYGEAAAHIDTALRVSRQYQLKYTEFVAGMGRAECKLASGDVPGAIEGLQAALALGRSYDYMTCQPWWRPHAMANLLGLAVQYDIERDYVVRFIRRRALLPPGDRLEKWPWHIRIHAFGTFDVIIDGESVNQTRRPQKKVIDLLKAIIAFGGREASTDTITAALWPDAEGDAARDAFDITLHRLRRLLGRENVVTLNQGKLAIDQRLCWIDSWAFEELTSVIDTRAQSVRQIVAIAERVLQLYRGHFLASDGEEPCIVPHRERLRWQLGRVMTLTGRALEEADALEQAETVYRRMLELEPLAEEFYRQLMLVLGRATRYAEALDVYRRCRETLSVVLGVKPSPETEAALALIRRGA
jgi:ATP/maltotriose-dependent transcriptional regulator MalT/DNA-binding SARP family transcriptional activator